MRFRVLTRFYDPLIRATVREAEFKRRLLDRAALAPGDRVLDLGCGTGTLAIAVKDAQPGATVHGLDGDPEILEIARRKSAEAGLEASFDEGLSTELPYEIGSFDVVLSTLFFHHLTLPQKERTAAEVRRVLAPGGRLLVADWGPPQDRLMAVASLGIRMLDGFEPTRENFAGALPSIFAEAGLEPDQAPLERLRTVFGSLALYRATGGPTDERP
ncbi:MAG: methyltransferase domain-containing protein [Actinobacteria bacterium]|nr:methyltransferase domain-containing protein [Actinomycetota bacterium]